MATEYERKRLENIRRNDEMMAALNVRAKASLLTAATKRPREESKSYKKKKEKQSKSETPIVMRKSLRTRGLDPEGVGLPHWFSDYPKRIPPPPSATLQKSSGRSLAPLPFDKAYHGEGSYRKFVETMLMSSASKSIVSGGVGTVKDDCSSSNRRRSPRLSVKGSVRDESDDSPMVNDCLKKEVVVKHGKIEFDKEPLSLESNNVARVVPGRVFVVKFMPCENVKLVAAGDKLGNVGFWNLDCDKDEENDGIYLFHPHTAPVSSLVFQQNSFSKVISSSYDGLIRLMDVEKSVFDLVYSCDDAIFSLSQKPDEEQSLYFGEGYGMVNAWDLRAGKSNFNWDLHEHRINSIDFNPQNPHVMATSSTDGTACLWDLRSMGATKKLKALKTVNHSRAVHSAYFSPTGLSLATTSVDNHIGLLTGANFEDISMISHDNTTNRWISTFRGVWGWDDSYIYVANLPSKGIDVISTKLKKTVKELRDPLMRAIPCRINCHPLNVGVLAGSTAGGQQLLPTPNVYLFVWELSYCRCFSSHRRNKRPRDEESKKKKEKQSKPVVVVVGDESYIFVGNRPSKAIDVISTKLKRRVKQLRVPRMKTIPCRIHCHPLNVGVLAG
ncbi:DROUGHT SENSITIVE 1 [Hirschfeldia incana]|nr:DROUGHT SENSITIVE 1 [Hirschfeldia incana]